MDSFTALGAIPTPSAPNIDPPTPTPSDDDMQWLVAYLATHKMSLSSLRYAFILWIVIGTVLFTFSIIHLFNTKGGVLGACWRKWALRRRTWRRRSAHNFPQGEKQSSYPTVFPANGQIFALVLLLAATLLLAFAGPDYIPGRPVTPSDPSILQHRPHHLIDKTWWTSAGRAGNLAFALLPLCVLFALKAPPFAIFALPFTIQVHFDKLAWLHRWSGRLIWLVALLHVSFWSVQLYQDNRTGSRESVYRRIWIYRRFHFGWAAFISMTLLILLSFKPLRKPHYEIFYGLHIILVPTTLVLSALHHPSVAWWCWIALGLWLAERVWRSAHYLRLNMHRTPQNPSADPWERQPLTESIHSLTTYPPLSPTRSLSMFDDAMLGPRSQYVPPIGYAHAELLAGSTIRLTCALPKFLCWAPGQHFLLNLPSISKFTTHPFTTASVCDKQSKGQTQSIVFLVRARNGWTKSLRELVVELSSKDDKHPASEPLPPDVPLPSSGALLKVYMEGPFGSAVRARWERYSTVVIVVGGSGASFGLSVLEYICLCLSGREGKHLGGRNTSGPLVTQRVRFVWIIRDFGHIQWCSSTLRRCIASLPSTTLEVNIFVTNLKPFAGPSTTLESTPLQYPIPKDSVAVDHQGDKKAKKANARQRHISADSFVDITYRDIQNFGDEGDAELQQEHEADIIALTNFEGDADTPLPGEQALHRRVMTIGKTRRAMSRRRAARIPMAMAVAKSEEPDSPVSYEDPFADGTSIRTSLASELRWSLPKVDTNTGRASFQGDSKRSPEWKQTMRNSARPLSATSERSNYSFDFDAASLYEPESQLSGTPLRVTSDDMQDISRVSEFARLGRPKLGRIISYEVEEAMGAVVVACCGPSSLNAMVRKAVASQINPSRVWNGDNRGHVDLVSEDFDY